MDKYAPFVWAAYGISAAGLVGVTTLIVMERARLAAKLRRLEAKADAPDASADSSGPDRNRTDARVKSARVKSARPKSNR